MMTHGGLEGQGRCAITMIIVEMRMTPMMANITTRMAALIMKCLHNKIMIEGRSTIIIIITR